MFADDTAVYDEVKSDSDRDHLQQNLDLLNEWETKWDMTFHPDKCVQLPVTRMKDPPATLYQLHKHTLDTVDSTDYLGRCWILFIISRVEKKSEHVFFL